jgi:hypothetical protein
MAALPVASLAQTNQVDADATQLLRKSTDYLAALKQYRVDTETTIEVVDTTGQKLQFGNRVVVDIQRPNKMRAERVGELVNQSFYYDGKTLSMNIPDQKYYATAAAPPTLEAMLDFARDDLNVIAPGTDLMYKNAYARLTEGLTSAFIVGKSVIGGVRCDQIAFRNSEVDWQIWIEDGATPVPRKFVVTSKKMPGSPQFAVLMTKWDPAPQITDATFAFQPPAGARKIEFLTASARMKK